MRFYLVICVLCFLVLVDQGNSWGIRRTVRTIRITRFPDFRGYRFPASRFRFRFRTTSWPTGKIALKRDSKDDIEDSLAESFNNLDQDENDLIDLAELDRLPDVFPNEDATPEDFMKYFDTNKDQMIDFDEFQDGFVRMINDDDNNNTK